MSTVEQESPRRVPCDRHRQALCGYEIAIGNHGGSIASLLQPLPMTVGAESISTELFLGLMARNSLRHRTDITWGCNLSHEAWFRKMASLRWTHVRKSQSRRPDPTRQSTLFFAPTSRGEEERRSHRRSTSAQLPSPYAG